MSDAPPPPPSDPPAAPAPAPGPHAGSAREPVSRLAIAALVLAVVGLIIPAVICGILALGRIRTRGQRGKGLAVAGLAVSGVWLLLLGVGLAVTLLGDTDRDASGRVTEAGSVSVLDLRPGDCVRELEETDATLAVDVVPCAETHGGEVAAAFDLPGDTWPGLDAVKGDAGDGCSRRLRSVASDEDVEVFFFHPTERSWESLDDREVLCAVSLDPPRRGSVAPG